jgi:hypothetical protein
MNTVEVVFTLVRRLVTFGLGCWIIGNALIHPDERISQLVVGMIMVGVLPIENLFSWRLQRTVRPPEEDEQGSSPGTAG